MISSDLLPHSCCVRPPQAVVTKLFVQPLVRSVEPSPSPGMKVDPHLQFPPALDLPDLRGGENHLNWKHKKWAFYIGVQYFTLCLRFWEILLFQTAITTDIAKCDTIISCLLLFVALQSRQSPSADPSCISHLVPFSVPPCRIGRPASRMGQGWSASKKEILAQEAV